MLKKMSAALILASLLAGPAMAAGPVLDTGKDLGKTAPKTETAAPMIKSDAKVAKPDIKPVADSRAQAKPSVLDAKAQAVKPHRRHIRHHHRSHEKLGMHKTFRHSAHKSTVVHSKRG